MNAAKEHLYILWSNAEPITAEKMVFMYAINSKLHGWWDEVTLIVWGASTTMAASQPNIQSLIKEALDSGVRVSACKRCADDLGATAQLRDLGVEVIYWGQPLTALLKAGETLLTL